MSNTEWLQKKKLRIGGSDIEAICGLSQYRNIMDVWIEKTKKNTPEQFSPIMETGKKLEDYIARRFERESGLTVVQPNEDIYILPENEIIRGSVDRFVLDEGDREVLECKSTRTRLNTMLERQDYVAQGQWYGGILKAKKIYYAWLILPENFNYDLFLAFLFSSICF